MNFKNTRLNKLVKVIEIGLIFVRNAIDKINYLW